MQFISFNQNIPKTTREGKGNSIIAIPSDYCVIDIETTGLSPQWDSIIEIGAIRYINGEEKERFQTFVRPEEEYDGIYIDKFIEDLTGITNEMLKIAPDTGSAIKAFDDFLKDDIIIGYNVSFDVNFLFDAFLKWLNKPLKNDFIDIMRFSRKLYPDMPHHRLCDMVEQFDIKQENAHRALSDVEATNECYRCMTEEAVKKYGDEESFLKQFKRRSDGSMSHAGVKAKDIQGDESKIDTDSPLYGKHCVFTGKLERFTRKEAMQLVADLGGINEDGVNKKTNFLILGNNDYCPSIKDGKSTKHKKAEKLKLEGQDIDIVTEDVFYDMIGDMF